MIHSCNIHCHAIDMSQADLLGISKDKGKWLPFAFHMGIVTACKMTTDDEDELVNGCTTLFTENGENYIIDTPYKLFESLFIQYNGSTKSEPEL